MNQSVVVVVVNMVAHRLGVVRVVALVVNRVEWLPRLAVRGVVLWDVVLLVVLLVVVDVSKGRITFRVPVVVLPVVVGRLLVVMKNRKGRDLSDSGQDAR